MDNGYIIVNDKHYQNNMKTNFTNLINLLDNFPDESSCRKHFEEIRWGNEPACPRCGDLKVYRHKDGKLFTCSGCNRQFTVKVGTIFEDSHISLRKWFMAIYILTSHKKGISSIQLSKDIGVTQKTSWYMLHRIRHMLSQNKEPVFFTGVVEMDEMYVGGKPKKGDRKFDENGKKIRKSGRGTNKPVVFGMVERNGKVFAQHVSKANSEILHPLIKQHVSSTATIITDEAQFYNHLGMCNVHKRINHSAGEYAKPDGTHTNTIEGFWGLMKRGLVGTYHIMSVKHLNKYCDEFTYRYSTRILNEQERFNKSLGQSEGRLMYKELTANEKSQTKAQAELA